jgi:hypothetical protein
MTETSSKIIRRMAFQRGDFVRVPGAGDARGRIRAILEDEDGVQYGVVYWCGEQRRSEWMLPWEIAPDDGSATA